MEYNFNNAAKWNFDQDNNLTSICQHFWKAGFSQGSAAEENRQNKRVWQKPKKLLKKQEITLIIVKGDGWERAKKEKNQKETAKEREGLPATKSEISFGVVPVVILRGFPVWAAQLITPGLQTLKGNWGEREEDSDETDVDRVREDDVWITTAEVVVEMMEMNVNNSLRWRRLSRMMMWIWRQY